MTSNASSQGSKSGQLWWVLGLLLCIGLIAAALFLKSKVLTPLVQQGKQTAVETALDAIDVKGDEVQPGFHVVDGVVVFESAKGGTFLPEQKLTEVPGADPATFRTFPQKFPEGSPRVYFAADGQHVYFHASGKLGTLDAEPDSFRLLDEAGTFAADATHVYYQAIEIPGASAKTFRRLAGDFAVDDDQAFLGHVPLPAQAATFQSYSPGRVGQAWHAGRPQTDTTLLSGWCGDAEHVYFGQQRMDNIDVASFRYLGFRDYAADARQVYYGAHPVEGADVATSKSWARST